MSKFRKAIAAFLVPLLGLPLAEWVTGDAAFDGSSVLKAFGAGLIAAVAVYFTPNAPAA